jgi:predicted NBD/HSP70 family sugar kinase
MRKMDLRHLAPADPRLLRDLNEVMVLNVIRERQPISRIDIAELTGLEGSTVSRIVTRLLADDVVYEEGLAEASPKGGRKKRYLHINPRKALAIGVDIRPGGYSVALSDFGGTIVRSVDVPGMDDPRAAMESIARVIRRVMKSFKDATIEGIGVSLVGLVEPKEGRILVAEGLGWGEDIPVGAYLREGLQSDIPIYYDNGAWLSALAEIWFGRHARNPRNLVFLDIEEGIGAGIIIRGQLYHGSSHGAGEFGHISLDPEGPLCSCGAHGCLEAFASNTATQLRYAARLQKAGRPAEPEVTIEEVVERALGGEPEAVETVSETAAYLGRGLVPIVYSLNPEVIVLGGAITKAWNLVHSTVSRELALRTSRFFLQNLHLIPTTLQARPSLLGAIALVLARSFAVPLIASSGDQD